ncbi:hypothetical protein BH18THE2_BH18THE2_29410 [soil metagenome]
MNKFHELKKLMFKYRLTKKLAIGEGSVLRVTTPYARCVTTTLTQGDLLKDLGILRTLAKYNHMHMGIYASVCR